LPSEEFEALYGVPHGIDFSGLAPLYGATFARVSTASDVVLVAQRWQNQPGLKIIEWQTAQRSQNADWHQDLWSRLNQALPTGEFDD
jgi:2-succinyl-5-enolpyruvyl-6-hydroxy-3-cyclohexene-1-carboxylate synthase